MPLVKSTESWLRSVLLIMTSGEHDIDLPARISSFGNKAHTCKGVS